MSDGSVLVVETAAGRITRVGPDGSTDLVAEPGGGPNGLAIGPDGKLYCCNNGGFGWFEADGMLLPHGTADDYAGGRIERIDLASGAVEVLYRDGDHGCRLRGPNDIVFDRDGGFWFTDHGKTRPRERDITGIFYARADGSHLEEVIFPSENPNGIGLSPDGRRLYVAETYTCRLMAFDIVAPGRVAAAAGPAPPGIPLYRPAGYKFFDSLAVEAGGNVEGAKAGEVVTTANGVQIVGHTNLPGRIAADASALYAKNLVAFVGLMIKDGVLALDLEDEITKGALVTHDGQVVNAAVRAKLGLG
jgi:gluconolactonase